MAEAQRGLRVYLLTEEQLSILTNYLDTDPNSEIQAMVDLVQTQTIGMLPAADMGSNQGERQAQFAKYQTAIQAAISGVEPENTVDSADEMRHQENRDRSDRDDRYTQEPPRRR
jgi:hypothetical protein